MRTVEDNKNIKYKESYSTLLDGSYFVLGQGGTREITENDFINKKIRY
jgi:hypothetical protein